MDSITIAHTIIKDTPMTSICIGSSSGELPKHLMTGEKSCGYIVRDDEVTPWYWQAISDRGEERFLVFDRLAILPFSEINRSLRPQAYTLLRSLAEALQKVPAGFVHPTNGFLETWRMFFLEEGGFLLLPESLSQIMLFSTSDADRFFHLGRYFKPNVEHPFGLCHQFTQFLYQAVTGFAPFEDADVREDRWRHLPLALGFTALNSESAQWIDWVLAMEPKEQREQVSAAYSAEENLSWWLEKTAALNWPTTDESQPLEVLEQQHRNVQEFRTSQHRRATRRIFWRKRGALVVTTSLIAILVFSIIGTIVYRELQPPSTAGMSPPQIIYEFIEAQNSLDVSNMGASLARGTKNPYEMEVSGLFVSTKVRQAYEGVDPVMRADTWWEQGKPAIPETSMVYGTLSAEIIQIDESTFRAVLHTLSPLLDGEEESTPGFLLLHEIERIIDFDFRNTKGYWQITNITPIKETLLATHKVETYSKENRLLSLPKD